MLYAFLSRDQINIKNIINKTAENQRLTTVCEKWNVRSTLDRETAKGKLQEWYKDANKSFLREMKAAKDSVKSRDEEILNYFIDHSTNAVAESFNSKIKGFRAQLRSVSDLTFFMFRLCTIFG